MEQLKIRVLDTLDVAIGALGAPPILAIRALIDELGGRPHSTLIGGGKTAPDRAAFFKNALSRYLDFMDSYIGTGETCHPSDNIAPVLAAAEMRDAPGADFLTAIAIAYQVPIRADSSERARSGAGQGLRSHDAGSLCGGSRHRQGARTARPANRQCDRDQRDGKQRVADHPHWRPIALEAYPNTARDAMHAALLASRGITGPSAVFEGNKGFMQTIAGPFEIDWEGEDLESVHHRPEEAQRRGPCVVRVRCGARDTGATVLCR